MDFNPYDLLDAEGATDADPQALKNLSKPAAKKEEPKGMCILIVLLHLPGALCLQCSGPRAVVRPPLSRIDLLTSPSCPCFAAAAKAAPAKTAAAPATRGGRGGDRGGRGPSRGRGFGGAPRADSGDVAENGYDEGDCAVCMALMNVSVVTSMCRVSISRCAG